MQCAKVQDPGGEATNIFYRLLFIGVRLTKRFFAAITLSSPPKPYHLVNRFGCAILPLCFCLTSAAQTPSPAFTYDLHARRAPRGHFFQSSGPPRTVFTRTDDGSLLIFISQGGRKWVLKRLTGWNTREPKEETLLIKDGVERDPDEWVEARLTLLPKGDSVLIRITASRNSGEKVVATLVLVDLHTFTIVYTRTSNDRFMVRGDWHLGTDGFLISRLWAEPEANPPRPGTTASDQEAQALTLPDLKAAASCRYMKVLKHGSGVESDEDVPEVRGGCDGVLKAAGVSAIDDLWKGSKVYGLEGISLPGDVNCGATGISDDERFLLYLCDDTGVNSWDIVTTNYASVMVTSVATKGRILNVPVNVKANSNEFLASVGKQQYLLLLIDGIHLAVYSLP